MIGMWRRLRREVDGAVAPTVALSLVALIAVGGIAFDYARLASLDTELQQAADQAALAAASQLDRMDGAQQRATDAISSADNADRLAVNFTRFSNDAGGSTVNFTIRFCSEFDDEVADTTAACAETDEDEDSRFVVVTTEARAVNYALTPIVAAVSSGPITASAVAGIEATICNVAPLMVCAPNDDFPTADDIGKGLALKPLDGTSGNYGLLDFGSGLPAVTAALLGHGLDGCQSTDDNQTETGTKAQVTDAINTRMDVYAKNNQAVYDQQSGPKCDTTDGTGCPALSARKDVVVRLEATANATTTAPAALSCPANPKTAGEVFKAPSAPVVGFNRDDCHYSNTCGTGYNANLGDGNWNRTAFFAQNHGGNAGPAATFAGKSEDKLTRYDVYRWELADAAARLQPKSFVTTVRDPPPPAVTKNGRYKWTVTNQCTYSQPMYGSTAYPAEKDRRILPIVAANCENLKGKGTAFEDYVILRVFDIFLTEPSENRKNAAGEKVTDEKEIYGEIIGPAEPLGGGSGFQYYSRSRPYLVR